MCSNIQNHLGVSPVVHPNHPNPCLPAQITFTAALDAIDLDILIDRLEKWADVVLDWFCSDLSGRKPFVSLCDLVSQTFDIDYGVPPGSVLGPVPLYLYMLPLGNIISHHDVKYHCYADDTQFYISVSPDNPSSLNALINGLFRPLWVKLKVALTV